MNGNLFCYDTEKRLCAFESPNIAPQDNMQHMQLLTVVAIGGMSDGMLCLPWIGQLAEKLTESLDGISGSAITTVQPTLSSSYGQWGVQSLKQDALELCSLLTFLNNQCPRQFILIGHSTGCQDVLELCHLLAAVTDHNIRAIVLQSPVPDRMFLASVFPDWREMLAWAQIHIDDEIYPKMLFGRAPISAYRLKSLLEPGGDDDYFSLSDITSEQRALKYSGLKGMNIPCYVQWSGQEEFLGIEGTELWEFFSALGDALKEACGTIEIWPVLPIADHAIGDIQSQAIFVERVVDLTRRVLVLSS